MNESTEIEGLSEGRRARPPKRYRLSDLVAQMASENRRPEVDFGPPVGREFGAEGWDE